MIKVIVVCIMAVVMSRLFSLLIAYRLNMIDVNKTYDILRLTESEESSIHGSLFGSLWLSIIAILLVVNIAIFMDITEIRALLILFVIFYSVNITAIKINFGEKNKKVHLIVSSIADLLVNVHIEKSDELSEEVAYKLKQFGIASYLDNNLQIKNKNSLYEYIKRLVEDDKDTINATLEWLKNVNF
mgnify:CR=1 FL=1